MAGLSTARFGLTLSNNYRTGAQAEQAAESGLVHAVRAINNTGGVTSFLNRRRQHHELDALIGTSALQMPGYSNITYSVNYVTNPAPTASDMWITSSGQVPWHAERTVSERLGLLPPSSCGAIDLPSTGISANFNGSTFSVDGNDYAIGATTPTSVLRRPSASVPELRPTPTRSSAPSATSNKATSPERPHRIRSRASDHAPARPTADSRTASYR